MPDYPCAFVQHPWLLVLLWLLLCADLWLAVSWHAATLHAANRVHQDTIVVYERAGHGLGLMLATVVVYLPRLAFGAAPIILALLLGMSLLVRVVVRE